MENALMFWRHHATEASRKRELAHVPTRHVMSVELKLYRSVALTPGTPLSKHQEINLAQLIARGNKKNEEATSFKMFK